jgi:hypothetical protein
MKNSKNCIKQIAESYIKMKLDEAAGDDFIGPKPSWERQRPSWYDKNNPMRWDPNSQTYGNYQRDGYRVPRNMRTPQTPQAPRVPTTPTTTTRPGFRPPFTPKLPTTPLGRLGLVGAVAAGAYGLGTAIDQYIINPQGAKPTPRPYQQDVLPSPESLYPAPSVSQNHTGGYGGSGSGGSGGGLGGGMGGSGR